VSWTPAPLRRSSAFIAVTMVNQFVSMKIRGAASELHDPRVTISSHFSIRWSLSTRVDVRPLAED
jgi:hypothetical protein